MVDLIYKNTHELLHGGGKRQCYFKSLINM